MHEIVKNIKRPLKKGEVFLVPCIYREEDRKIEDEQDVWMDLGRSRYEHFKHITPVLDHPHSDRENGQSEIHYHVDYRFVRHKKDTHFPTVKVTHSQHKWVENIRPQLTDEHELVYFLLPVINEEFAGVTSTEAIHKSTLKHTCIHKGKCPHRGFDMSQVPLIDGVRTCPLHGLKFDENGDLFGGGLWMLDNDKPKESIRNYPPEYLDVIENPQK